VTIARASTAADTEKRYPARTDTAKARAASGWREIVLALGVAGVLASCNPNHRLARRLRQKSRPSSSRESRFQMWSNCRAGSKRCAQPRCARVDGNKFRVNTNPQ
jgi:hypothetical protein